MLQAAHHTRLASNGTEIMDWSQFMRAVTQHRGFHIRRPIPESMHTRNAQKRQISTFCDRSAFVFLQTHYVSSPVKRFRFPQPAFAGYLEACNF